jgi:hypothetical protein
MASCSLQSDDVYIICDGYKLGKKALKSGIIDNENSYLQYLNHLEAEYGMQFNIVKHFTRNGFAKNIKLALNNLKYKTVLVLQHDYIFNQSLDFNALIQLYFEQKNINYLGFHCPVEYCNKKMQFYDATTDIIPLDFWYDKPHLADVHFYKSVVFKWPCRNFIEDSFGQRMRRDILQHQNHEKYKAFLLNIPKLIAHTNGRKLKNKILNFEL